ncbi:MAG: hypothetical protein ACPL3S_01460 [Halothiobacillaceae bacterium]
MHTYIADSAAVLSGPVELPIIPGIGIQLPSNAIQLPAKLANPAAGHVWAMVDGQPQQVADHRGTVYSTDTGAELQHTKLGDLPAGTTAEPRPSADHSWIGSAWAFDAVLQSANRLALAVGLCESVDAAADAARAAVVGDPLRAVEYERAASEAQSFADAGYQGDVPPMVAAWAISGRTTQQAAEDILREAAQYDGAIVQLRTLRLEAKELIRAAMSEGNAELAENIATEAITAIQAAVVGIGNNT